MIFIQLNKALKSKNYIDSKFSIDYLEYKFKKHVILFFKSKFYKNFHNLKSLEEK